MQLATNDINVDATILLDTHVLVWLDARDPQLGDGCRRTVDGALAGDRLAVSAISFWEVAMLKEKGRLAMDVSVVQWRRDLLASGLREIPLDGGVGVRAVELTGLHRDPMDRLIAATAEVHGCTLATADARLLDWHSGLPRLDARR